MTPLTAWDGRCSGIEYHDERENRVAQGWLAAVPPPLKPDDNHEGLIAVAHKVLAPTKPTRRPA